MTRGLIKVDDDTVKQIAVKRARGAPLREIETEFNLTRPVVNRVLSTDLARDTMKEFMADVVAVQILQTRKDCAELLPLAVEAVKKKLEEGDLKAAEMVFKVSGMLVPGEDKNNKQQQAIQVILPGAIKEATNVQLPEGV